MPKGRPASPTSVKRGTNNKSASTQRRKTAEASLVTVQAAPEQFPPTAVVPAEVHDVWRSVVADLGGANNMRQSFVPAIEAYCLAVYTHAQAAAQIREYGVLVKGNNGPMANPMLKVQKDSAASMLRFAETLGLTPAARIRLGLMEITGMSLLSTLNAGLDK